MHHFQAQSSPMEPPNEQSVNVKYKASYTSIISIGADKIMCSDEEISYQFKNKKKIEWRPWASSISAQASNPRPPFPSSRVLRAGQWERAVRGTWSVVGSAPNQDLAHWFQRPTAFPSYQSIWFPALTGSGPAQLICAVDVHNGCAQQTVVIQTGDTQDVFSIMRDIHSSIGSQSFIWNS